MPVSNRLGELPRGTHENLSSARGAAGLRYVQVDEKFIQVKSLSNTLVFKIHKVNLGIPFKEALHFVLKMCVL